MRSPLILTVALVALALVVGCGGVAADDDAGRRDDSGAWDAGGTDAGAAVDAGPSMPDARPPITKAPTQEVTSGGASVSGSTYSVDVQLGHWMSQAPAIGGGKRVEGASAIK